MPLKRYGVLKGRPIDVQLGAGESPHYQVHIVDDTTDYRIAINVKSKSSPSELLYLVAEQFQHPLIALLGDLPLGFTDVAPAPGGRALDFIRGNLFDPAEMRKLPHSVPGPDNDLNEKIDAVMSRAQADETVLVYAFGERWGPEADRKDKYFGFLPGNGIHDIHMNQGNDPQFQGQDGVWQDGAVLVHFPAADAAPEQWVGIFLAFQSQAWHTDDHTGHTVGVLPEPGPAPVPGPGEPDGIARIVAALVNPPGPAPEAETITLLNASPQPVDLAGWSITDRAKHQMTLDGGPLAPGDSIRVQVTAPVQLGNQGGQITLLNPGKLKVDGVAYTKAQAAAEGWTIIF